MVNYPPAEALRNFSQAQAANLIVRINKAKMEQFVRCRWSSVSEPTKEKAIKKLLEEYLDDPEHQALNIAFKKSHYYNGGTMSPLIYELSHGL